MQWSPVIVGLLLQLSAADRFTAAGQSVVNQVHADEEAADRTGAEPRGLKPESVLMSIAKTLIGGKTAAVTDQSLSLNMSNLVLMLVLRGLIWGVSYMQNSKQSRTVDDVTYSTVASEGLSQDAVIETDVMLFLGYLVADKSGRYDCLNRVACEQPARAESYLRSGEMMWKTAKMLDGVVPLDAKYEKMLRRLEEAIEDGRAKEDCQAKYKCFARPTAHNISPT